MELSSCSHLHFIQAIRAELVEKICNLDSHGRPALVFKNLTDIYDSVDGDKCHNLSTLKSHDGMYECDRVKTERPCLPLVERKTKKRDTDTDEFNCKSDDGEEGGDLDDLNFGKMTLKQLRDQSKTKKRKFLHFVCSTLNQEEDDCDLKESISSWKSKISKNLKGKRKRAKKCLSSSSQIVGSVKSEQVLSSEDSLQPIGYLPAPISIKVEVSEVEYSECRNMVCVTDVSSIGCSELVGLHGELSREIIDDVKAESEFGKLVSLAKECRSCVVNQISYDHLEHSEPTCFLPSIDGEAVEADNLKKSIQQFLVLPRSEDKGEVYIQHPLLEESSPETIFPVIVQGSHTCNISSSHSSAHKISRQTTVIPGVQAPNMAMDDKICCMELGSEGDPCNFEDDLDIDSLSSPLSICSTSLSPKAAFDLVKDDLPLTEKPTAASVSADTARNCSSPDKPVAFGGGSTSIEEKQPTRSAPHDAERNSPKRKHRCGVVYELSAPKIKSHHCLEQCHPPERLLSARKAISPVSQKILCQAMKGVEVHEDIEHYKCEEKLQVGKETENKASPMGLDTEGAEVNTNPEGQGEVSRIKGSTSPNPITKKLKNDRKGSPPQGIRRVPHLFRSLPQVSTGATSIQGCSESAVAFSQQQMHGIERLALKLMQELKSMKDIVDRKLHSEVSPTAFVKYHDDEVKTAIKRATKVEETTRKWLSMMARDCNRFCKLMSLTEKGEITSRTAIHKERKKITFADEAGGVLCHVKIVEDSTAPLDFKS